MKKSIASGSPVFAKVNVVPMIDVALVLVVILLVTAPMLTVRQMDLTLPTAETRGAEDELRVSVSLARDGELAVDEDLVTMDGLASALSRRILATNRDVLVVVRADDETPYETVQTILREARHAGAKRLAIATQQGTRREHLGKESS